MHASRPCRRSRARGKRAVGREVRGERVLRWASLLVVALASPATLADASTTERSEQLTKYCASARPLLRYDAVDPALLSAGARYTPPRPSAVMGQKVSEVSRRIAMQGTVLLGAVVNSVGRVAHVAVVERSAHTALDREAIVILKDADFVPATLNGKAVRSCTMVRFEFKVTE
jgi:TonB family protein